MSLNVALAYSKEPWRVERHSAHEGFGLYCDAWGFLAFLNSGAPDEANAQRIVACVNACAGLPTEELERYAKHAPYTAYAALKAECGAFSRQVKDLREALEAVVDSVTPKAEREAIDFARALLSKYDPDGPTPNLVCDYAHLPHSGGGTDHGTACHDLRGYTICDKCYDAIIAAEQREAGNYLKKDSA